MPKDIKGYAARKPPEPTTDHAQIDDWLRRQMPDLQPVLRRLDESITDIVPDLRYALARKRPYYGVLHHGWIIELAAYAVSVNVVFLGGADLEPPPPLGTVDRSRYVKVTTLEQAQQPQLRQWIKQASLTPGWR